MYYPKTSFLFMTMTLEVSCGNYSEPKPKSIFNVTKRKSPSQTTAPFCLVFRTYIIPAIMARAKKPTSQ